MERDSYLNIFLIRLSWCAKKHVKNRYKRYRKQLPYKTTKVWKRNISENSLQLKQTLSDINVNYISQQLRIKTNAIRIMKTIFWLPFLRGLLQRLHFSYLEIVRHNTSAAFATLLPSLLFSHFASRFGNVITSLYEWHIFLVSVSSNCLKNK